MKRCPLNFKIVSNLIIFSIFIFIYAHYSQNIDNLKESLDRLKRDCLSDSFFMFEKPSPASLLLNVRYCPDAEPRSNLLFHSNNQFTSFPVELKWLLGQYPADFGVFQSELGIIKIYSQVDNQATYFDQLIYNQNSKVVGFRLMNYRNRVINFSLSNCL